MRVRHVRIKSFLGVRDVEFSPGTLTVIEGGNGVGKSSIIEAFKSALGGGQDASLLRLGDERGEIGLTLDDDTEIVGKIDKDGIERSVRHVSFGKLSKPSTYLKKLTDALSVNPLDFLMAPPKKRAEWLLEVLPVTVTDDDLRGCGVAGMPPTSANGLERIDVARKAVYEMRTGVNVRAKDRRATVKTLRASLGAAATEAPNVRTLRQQKADLAADQTRRTQAIRDRVGRPVSVDCVIPDLPPSVAEWANGELERIRGEASRRARALRATEQEELAALAAEVGPRLEELASQIGQAEELERRATQDAQTRTLADQQESEAVTLETQSQALTTTIEALDALRARALDSLPIPGLEVRDGEVYGRGIPFDRLNHATRVEFALNIARVRAGELGLVLVDGLECLDPQTFAAFEAAVPHSGLQFVVTRVTEGPLSIRSGASLQEATNAA